MMRIRPALSGISFKLRRAADATSDMATSDMDCLPYEREVQGKGCTFAGAALYPNISRMFLNDSVGHGKPQAGAAILALGGGCFGGEEWIIDALNVFLSNAGAGVGDAHADEFAIHRGYVQHSTAHHGVLGIEEQIEKHLLQTSRVALDQRKPIVQ